MWLQWKLIGCDNLHRSEALQFFRRWRCERREKDMDGHEEESWINDFQLHFSGKYEHRNTGKIPHRLGKLRVLVSACILCFLIIYSLYNLIYVCKYISYVLFLLSNSQLHLVKPCVVRRNLWSWLYQFTGSIKTQIVHIHPIASRKGLFDSIISIIFLEHMVQSLFF